VDAGTRCQRLDKDAYETKSREIQARRRDLRARNAPESEMDQLFTEELNCPRRSSLA